MLRRSISLLARAKLLMRQELRDQIEPALTAYGVDHERKVRSVVEVRKSNVCSSKIELIHTFSSTCTKLRTPRRNRLQILDAMVEDWVKSADDLEQFANIEGVNYLIGFDEAGRGCLAGPVVASGAFFPFRLFLEGLRDSKRLTEPTRKQFITELLATDGVMMAVDVREADYIDKHNILQATRDAMGTCANLLAEAMPELSRDGLAMIDGSHLAKGGRLGPFRAKEFVKGDDRFHNIAAAALLAKTVRDALIVAVHNEVPQYNFKNHKGYGTRESITRALAYGAVEGLHRRSFKPLSESERWIDRAEAKRDAAAFLENPTFKKEGYQSELFRSK